MSTCISPAGEYSDHVLDDAYTCTRCLVLDEDALVAELRQARARLAEVEAERDAARAEAAAALESLTELAPASLKTRIAALEAAAREWRATGHNGGFDHLAASLHLVDAVDALPTTPPTATGGGDG